jgi:hypothetical protein
MEDNEDKKPAAENEETPKALEQLQHALKLIDPADK